MSEELIVKHEKSPHYGSYVATGCFVSGPTADGMVHIQFYRDTTYISEERGTEIPGTKDAYKLDVPREAIKNYREVQSTMSLPLSAIHSLQSAIAKHFPQ